MLSKSLSEPKTSWRNRWASKYCQYNVIKLLLSKSLSKPKTSWRNRWVGKCIQYNVVIRSTLSKALSKPENTQHRFLGTVLL